MSELRSMHCASAVKGSLSLSQSDIEAYLLQVPEWNVVEIEGIKQLEKQFGFNNFSEALNFSNKVGKLAEQEDHHPAIMTEWGRVRVTWWTHAVKGLHLNDFIMAAKTDELYIE
jgi:4a-hydroxytetrahydrobiopterin dehydratase